MITRIRGGTVITPEGPRAVDLWIEGERIAAIGSGPGSVDRTIDASGCFVLPGGIDPHVHIGFTVGEFTSSDDFVTGSRAAAYGGVTTILDFAVPTPGETISGAVERRIREAEGRSAVDFGVHAVVTSVDADVPGLVAGCVARGVPDFKVFTTYDGLRLELQAMAEVIRRVGEAGGLVMVHAEDDAGIRERVADLVAEGRLSPESHSLSRPGEVEDAAVAAVLAIQAETGCALHVVHVSSAAAAARIRDARRAGADVSAETCPHYLLHTCDVYRGERAALYMVSPPIKTRRDQEGLWTAFEDGTIEMASTDHCPFTSEEKGRYNDFRRIPTGLPGVETTLPLLFTAWREREWPLERLADRLSTGVAKRFGLFPRKGILAEGSDADVVVYDPRPSRVIRAAELQMNVDWSPFEGRTVQGCVRDVLIRGVPRIEGGTWRGGLGRFVPRATVGRLGPSVSD